MLSLLQCLLAVVVAVQAEAPGGYSYSRPSGGYSGGGGGGYSGGGGGGGGYVPVPVGPSSNEGQYVDQQLLGQIRQIILQHESQSSSGGGGGGGYSSGPSSSYGVPSSSYGAPSGGYSSRVVGVDLEGVQPAIQVAQYEQSSGSSGGYSNGGYSSGGPSSSYGAPARSPSSSYGAPF